MSTGIPFQSCPHKEGHGTVATRQSDPFGPQANMFLQKLTALNQDLISLLVG